MLRGVFKLFDSAPQVFEYLFDILIKSKSKMICQFSGLLLWVSDYSTTYRVIQLLILVASNVLTCLSQNRLASMFDIHSWEKIKSKRDDERKNDRILMLWHMQRKWKSFMILFQHLLHQRWIVYRFSCKQKKINIMFWHWFGIKVSRGRGKEVLGVNLL